MFAWAGAQSSPSDPSAFVQSFITNFDQHNCTAMRADVYRLPGSAELTCPTGPQRLSNCTYATSSAKAEAPSTFTDPASVIASCDETSLTKAGEKTPISIEFSVATDPTNSVQYITFSQVVP